MEFHFMKEKISPQKPFLSVYIPTHERPLLLENCLNHLLDVFNQGVSLEVLIYDSSSDGINHGVIDAFKEKVNDQFRVFYKQKQYDHIVWKTVDAFQDAQGTYVTYLADDDYFHIPNLKEALFTLKHNPSIQGWFATWQLWDDEQEKVVNQTNEHGLSWMTKEAKTYTMDTVLELAQEVIVQNVCPEIYIMKVETGRKILIDWRYPDEQIALFILFRTLRFGALHLTNTPFYKYCDVRKSKLLEGEKETHTHYGERLYKEAPFMTRFSREWFVSQAFREAGFDEIPEESKQKILTAIMHEYAHRLKGNGIAAAFVHNDMQHAHRFISTMASWNKALFPKEELYKFEMMYLVPYALQSIEKRIQHVEENQAIQVFGFGESDVLNYFSSDMRQSNIQSTIVQDIKELKTDSIVLVPLPKHRKKLTQLHGFSESKVIALEDIMNTLRMIRDPLSADAFVMPGFKI